MNKGKLAEHRFVHMARDALGDDSIRRELNQPRSGGYDVRIPSPGAMEWGVEVKASKRMDLPGWWRQACEQADKAEGDVRPAVAYTDGTRWRVLVALDDVRFKYQTPRERPYNSTVVMLPELFWRIVRGEY